MLLTNRASGRDQINQRRFHLAKINHSLLTAALDSWERHGCRPRFVDSIDVVFDATIPYDLSFFQSLDRMVQNELRLVRDKALIDPLKSIGIEKGTRFNPDVKTRDLHNEAREAHAWLGARHHGPMVL